MAAPNPLRVDPTRTTDIRRRFAADVRRRFDALRADLLDLVVKEDAFGLGREASDPFTGQKSNYGIVNAEGVPNCGTGAGGFKPGNKCARGGGLPKEFDTERLSVRTSLIGESRILVDAVQKQSETDWLSPEPRKAVEATIDVNSKEGTFYVNRIDALVPRRKYAAEVLRETLRILFASGYSQGTTYVEHDNEASARMMTSLGGVPFKDTGKGLYYRFVRPTSVERSREEVSQVQNVRNAEGDPNCGTGAGGFKPGNKCARGGGSSDVRSEVLSYADGREHLVLVGADGRVIGRTSGDEGTVETFKSELLDRPGAGLSSHHNHPYDSPPSLGDLLQLADHPGLETIYAHSLEATYRVRRLGQDRRELYFAVKDAYGAAKSRETDRILDLPPAAGSERTARQRDSQRRIAEDALASLVSKGLIEYERTEFPVQNIRWIFATAAEKVKAFLGWVKTKVDFHILGTTQGEQEANWWDQYLKDAMLRGRGRAFDDALRKAGQGTLPGTEQSKMDFLRGAFSNPLPVERAKQLAGRVLTDLKGVTEAMATDMSRTLLDGLARGDNPRKIGQDLADAVDSIGKKRGELIARTECLPADSLVDAAVVRAVFRRWYEGPMVEIVTRRGRKLTATPNHPMLTTEGWVGAGLLQEGDDLIRGSRDQQPRPGRDEHVQGGPTPICEVFDTLRAVCGGERVAGGVGDFHGDGRDGDVEILRPDGVLSIGAFPPLQKHLVESLLTGSDNRQGGPTCFCRQCGGLLPVDKTVCLVCGSENDVFFGQESLDDVAFGAVSAGQLAEGVSAQVSSRYVAGVDVGPRLVCGPSVPPGGYLRLGVGSGYPSPSQVLADGLLVGADSIGDLPLRESVQVETDQVVSTRVIQFSGHVYNLETTYGYYTIDEGYYTGNCIRAHAEGQLDGLQQMGVEAVSAMVEWSTAGDARVCPLCAPLEGTVLLLPEARGLIPRHPNCRCSWLPANVGESTKGQKRSLGSVGGALIASIKAESKRGTVKERIRASKWAGAGVKLSKRR